ncbi:MAG: polyketide synthase, partial [Acidobacteria bacterium]
MTNSAPSASFEEVVIIGMAGRFPSANSVDELWSNLRDGVESVLAFTDEDLLASGVDPALLTAPNYIKAGTVVAGPDLFDAAFFGFNPREAEITDPQHRLFLECAHQALELSGYDPQVYRGLIGVFAGSAISSYMINNLHKNSVVTQSVSPLQVLIGNDKDFVPTRVSYKLNLKGPSVNVQTACSTSLVAVHLACQSLLERTCDIALAGGVSVHFPQRTGYLYEEEGILSSDGHCRAFDAKARGTVGGNGVAIVVLKRLSEALADGDRILAKIKGSAINNDGSLKIGYTAPSVDGQSEVIASALALADVNPADISYVETHGTGTLLGDPLEIAALTQAFKATLQKSKGFCAIGSVKTNLGHLNAAAGVTGLIKTVLQLQHKQLVPSLHFEEPNPKIDFLNSPFYVNTKLEEWPSAGGPRRAGVSSFGIGGTNAHVVL